MKTTIIVEGRPVVTPRPRVLRKGYTYTPAKAKKAQQKIADAWIQTGKKPLTGPVMMDVKLLFTPPASWTKRKKEAALRHEVYPVSHTVGDIDNLLKTVLDGLNGVAYVDDSQVVRVVVRTDYDAEDYTKITITEL